MRFLWSVIVGVFLVGCLGATDAATAPSSGKGGKIGDAKGRSAPKREPADRDQQIADLRKQAKSLADREKSLEADIASKKKLLTAQADRSVRINAGATALADQRAATSATLALQRQAEANLADRLAHLNAALCRQGLAQHVRLHPIVGQRETLALYLTAFDVESVEQQRMALVASIRRTEQIHQQAVQALTRANEQQRETVAETDSRVAELKRLEKELDKARSDRRTLLSRAEALDKVRKSAGKEMAGSETKPPAADVASAKQPSGQPTPAKPTPSRIPAPRVTPPASVREGTGVDLLVPEGTEIHAIEAGEVIYADRFKGYGNLVIIEHADKILSLYGFLNRIAVASGAMVARGQVVGRSGFIEDKDRAGLRFEMRMPRGEREVLIDPRSWLPPGADFQRRLLRGEEVAK